MKKIITFITLGTMTVIMTTPVLSWDFISPEAANDFFARVERDLQAARDNIEKGKTDDAALKEGIQSIMLMRLHIPDEDTIGYAQELMLKNEIPRERQINILEEMIRETLSALERGDNIRLFFLVIDYIDMLGTFPDYDLLPLLKECINSKNGDIRGRAQRRYNTIMEKAQEAPKEGVKEEPPPTPVTSPSPTITAPPQPEPLPPAMTDEAEQPIQETPPKQPEKTSSNKTILWLAIIALLAIFGGVVAWRKK